MVAPDHPYVDTSIARLMRSRMAATHSAAGITVISGPWGIGKTTAINHFAEALDLECVVVKVEPVANKRGASAAAVMNQIMDALKTLLNGHFYVPQTTCQTRLRRLVSDALEQVGRLSSFGNAPRLTIVFDEAQYLSKQAIEMLRYWNDRDRTAMPFPVGLIFVGNNEFALQENLNGESVLSGAVRSRLMFEVPLAYTHVNDDDLAQFARSRGVDDPDAIADFVRFFSQPRMKRDLRSAERLLQACRDDAGENPVTREIVQSILHP